jgi:uncharacterized protein (DUF924 family)
MPLQHCEARDVQEESVAAYRRLLVESPQEFRSVFESALDSALDRHAIIERFGRFPNRNQALGRETTPQEETWLGEHEDRMEQ